MKKEELRKSPVVFHDKEHRYDLDGQDLHGITPIIAWLFPETYADIPEEVLERAKQRGTMIHAKCQMADNMGVVDCDEVKAYVELLKENSLTPIASEYTVSDEVAVASNIDKVFEDGSIADIKCTSKIHVPNVTLQLNIYAALFKMQNNRDVKKMYVIWLPREIYGKPCIKEVERIPEDVCAFIVAEYLDGHTYEAARAKWDALGIGEEKSMPKVIMQTCSELANIRRQIEALKAREDELKTLWLEAMQEAGEKKTGNAFVTVTRKEAGVRVSVDTKLLKSDYPDVYAKCMKESKTNETLLIKFKDE